MLLLPKDQVRLPERVCERPERRGESVRLGVGDRARPAHEARLQQVQHVGRTERVAAKIERVLRVCVRERRGREVTNEDE